MLLEGLFVPLTTPFYPNGRLYLRKLEHNVDRYSRTPAAGLAVLSETGEPSLLSDDETREALRTAISAASETKVMLAGVSRDSVKGTLDLLDVAAGLNYDAVLVKQPSLLGASSLRETYTYYRTVADRAAIPVVLYSTQAAPLTVEAIAELAGHPQIIGLADETLTAQRCEKVLKATAQVKREVTVTSVFAAVTTRMTAAKEIAADATIVTLDRLAGASVDTAPPMAAIKTRTKTVGFQVLAARTKEMMDALKAGCSGVMPALAAAAPQACFEVLAVWNDSDPALAEKKSERLSSAISAVEERLGVPGIRYASDLNGYFGGIPRLPRLSLTADERKAVETAMQGMRS